MRELSVKLANQRCRQDAGIGELLAGAAAIERWLRSGRMPEEITPDCKGDHNYDEGPSR